ncbi:MAG: hypothetical protein LQ346_002106 [Caloplaca aetnensis]|nr:MAG: hypothetical protein LQ346_002106 [Caloplaca aetnensis]
MTIASKLLHGTTALVAALSQQKTNGASQLGTLHAPKLPAFLTNNPVVNGFPWGSSKNAYNSDGYYDAPNTGVVRSFDFTIARGTVAPDGYEKTSLLINGQYPGPLIEANWGDTIQVTVHNAIIDPPEGTTLHWHGQRQRNSEWSDGVPSVSMYHSHFSSQYAEGLWGPMVIHGPRSATYDIDLGPITLNDYFHRTYFDVLKDVVGATDAVRRRPASDNNLINGKMNFDCGSSTTPAKCTNDAGLSKFLFTSGKTHLLRLINTGSQGIQKFSIDNHMMTVIANDFVPVQPYTATVVTLAVGQRTDVLIKATGRPGDMVWMRSKLAQGSCTEPALNPLALAVIYYEHANTTGVPSPNSTAHVDTTDPCSNDDLAKQVPAMKETPGDPAKIVNMNVALFINATGSLVWTINNQTFRGDYNKPSLLLAKAGNTSFPPERNVYNIGTAKSVRVIIKNFIPVSHPWHFHGHEVFVLAAGTGTWDGTIVNPSNPARRDVQLLPASGYLVLQWNSDNAGVWPFHCHNAWHLSGGLYANILENPAGIKALPIPSTSYQVCRDWADFTGTALPNQIDSGV